MGKLLYLTSLLYRTKTRRLEEKGATEWSTYLCKRRKQDNCGEPALEVQQADGSGDVQKLPRPGRY